MKISIITIVFNQEEFIRDAIDSVLMQDYDDIEYIVIDGKSTDGTLDAIKSYGDRISIVVSEKDKGLYDALNKGIRLATGDYIGIVHSDDMLYDKHVITKVVKELERTNCDILYGDGVFVPSDNILCVVRNWIGGTYSRSKLRSGWLPLHPTVYIKRDLYKQLGGFNDNFRISGDTDLLVRFLNQPNLKVTYLREYIIRMRLGGKSTSPVNSMDKWKEDWSIYSKYKFPVYALPCKILRKVPQYVGQKDFYRYLINKFKK